MTDLTHLPSYKQLVAQDMTQGAQPYGKYDVVNTGSFLIINLKDKSEKSGAQETGWKVHISIDPSSTENIQKAWGIFARYF